MSGLELRWRPIDDRQRAVRFTPAVCRRVSVPVILVVQLAATLFCLAVCCAASADEIRPDFAMHGDPMLTQPQTITRLPDETVALWRQALLRPEVEFQRQAAQAIAQAFADGFPDAAAALPELQTLAANRQTHPHSLYAALHALIVLDARDAAPLLFDAATRNDATLGQLVEPALAKWDYAPIRPVWRARLTDRAVARRDLLLALTGLGRAGDVSALPAMLELVNDFHQSGDVRLEAARASGLITDNSLESDARRLATRDAAGIVDRLCSARLLARHRSTAAIDILTKLGRDPEPAVAVAALRHLHAADPAFVVPLAEEALRSRDAGIRRCGVDAYVALPTAARIQSLAPLLDDRDPAVREGLREALYRLARQPEFDTPVRVAAIDLLHREGWRGQEQAALLLGALDHKPAAPRLVALLESNEPGVMVSSGWALRRLAVPDTFPAMLEKAARQADACENASGPTVAMHRQIAHLVETLGLARYAPAEPLLRRFVPKNLRLGEVSRAAAIWSLGLMLSGKADAQLASQLMDRVADFESLQSEYVMVRQMCAVTMARIGAKSFEPELRAMTFDYTIESALRWAIAELTGEQLPAPLPTIKFRIGSFLEPLEIPEQAAAR